MEAFWAAMSDNISAIIGVMGTLLGTILGWVLSKIKVGRITINFSHIESSCEYKDKNKETEPLAWYQEKFRISLYNSASEPKIIRDLCVIFKDENNNTLLSIKAQDDATTRIYGGAIISDEINLVNIDAKKGLDIEALYFTRDVAILRKARKAELHYKTEKMKAKKKIMWSFDYSKISDNIESEDD